MKKIKYIMTVLLFFMFMNGVSAKSATCIYESIEIKIDNNYNITSVYKNEYSDQNGANKHTLQATMLDLVKKDGNGNETYFCPEYIYYNVTTGGGGRVITRNFSFEPGDNTFSGSKLTEKLTDSQIDNTIINGGSENSKQVVRQCTYGTLVLYYYSDGTATVNGKNINLNGEDLSSYCPAQIYTGGYGDQFGVSLKTAPGITNKIELSYDNASAYKPPVKDPYEEQDDLPIKPIKLCTKGSGGLKVMQIIGYVLYLMKILVPLILIIMASIDLVKGVITSNEKPNVEVIKKLIIRVLIGIIIFIIPTVLDFLLSFVDGTSGTMDNDGKFTKCTDCLLDPFGDCIK